MMWFRKHLVWTNVLLVVAEVIVACLIWFSGEWLFAGSEETFGTLHSYIFIWIPVIIASIAALNSIFASLSAHDSFIITERSLDLTRASQRPFLNISRIYAQFAGDGIHPSPIRYFIIGVENTGNFPAEQVSISFNIWRIDDSDKHKFILKEKETTIYFPNEGNPNLHFIEADSANKLIIDVGRKLRVRIELNYYNKLAKTNHRTIRSYEAEYNKQASHNPIPIPDDDYWD